MRKKHDMVAHSWIKSVLEILKVLDNIERFIADSMENWRTILESAGQQLGEVRNKHRIFQRDS